ncbi:hypothetical protein FQZ97_989740 [compost metagenome]
MHGDQEAVEHREADRARADAAEARQRAVGVLVLAEFLAHFFFRREAAEDHQVVDRGVVVVRGMGAVAQVLQVQVQQRGAAQHLRRLLQARQAGLHLVAVEEDPDEAAVGHPLRRLLEEAQRAGPELDDLHAAGLRRAVCARRRARSRSARRRRPRA